MNNSQDIASKIKQTAKEKGITIKQLLKQCDLSINTLSDLAKGKQISYLNFAKIAECLNVSVDYLLGRTNNPQINSGNSITTGNIQGDNNANMSIGNEHRTNDEQEILEMIHGLSLIQRSEIIVMISKMKSKK